MGKTVPTVRRARQYGGLAVALAALSLAACATAPHPSPVANYKVGKPYQVRGVWYTPAEQPHYDEVGTGSWYGEQFHNRYTASGEPFDMDRLSAAHKTLPLPCLVEVTNLDNGRKAVLRVNDRGPFVDGRIIDLSRAAAQTLGYDRQGTARVRVRYIGPAPVTPADARLYQAAAPAKPSVPIAPRTVAAAAPRPLPSGWLSQPQFLTDQRPAGLGPAAPAAPAAPVAEPGEAAAAGYRIQAGAFAVRANAERAAAQLASAGPAQIVETERSGGVLYRVLIAGGDEDRAAQVRDQVAGLGYPDARVVSAY